MKRIAIAAACAIALSAAAFLFLRDLRDSASEHEGPLPPRSAPASPLGAPSMAAAPISRLDPTLDAARARDHLPEPFASVAPPPSVSSRPLPPLNSPQDTVSTQVALLQKGSDADFRATFTPEAQADLTAENIARCRAWLEGRPVKPHWAMAEESMKDGKRVVSVSMFGKSMTAFRETKSESGREKWQAESVWCLPPSP